MKKLLLLVTLFWPVHAFAVFSAFALVTPGSEYEQAFDFNVTHSENRKICTIEFNPVGYDHKHAWLVIASRPLSDKDQVLRDFAQQTLTVPAPPRSVPLDVFTKLSPLTHSHEWDQKEFKSRYRVSIKNELATRSYIYIDFPGLVLDGGYFYSIPLGEYCLVQN